jgi:hypothetical protein
VTSLLWKEDKNLNEASNILDDVSYIVISLFDTLILHQFKDYTHFHKAVYKRGYEEGLFSLEIGEEYYMNLRMKIQHMELSEATQPSLDGIFKRFPDKMVNVERLMNLELEVIKDKSYINPFLFTFLEDAYFSGKTVIFTANTPYSKSQLTELLKHIGLSKNLYSKIYCDFFFEDELNMKYFIERLLFSESMSEKDILYIDSKKQSILVAEKLKLRIIHYDFLSVDLQNPAELEDLYYQNNNHEWYMIRKAIANTIRASTNIFFKVGAIIIGPLLSMFILRVYEDLKKEKITLVLPLMREGELLSQMLNILLEKKNDSLIEVKPLYISRKSSYIPALPDNCDADEILGFFEKIPVNVNDLMELLEMQYFDEKYGKYTLYKLKSQYKNIYEQFKINFNEILDIRALKEKKRELISGYLIDEIKNHKNIATIDIGFNGTIQSNIEKILNLQTYEIKHYLLISRDEIVDKIIKGMRITSFINGEKNSDYKNDIIRAVDVFEQLVIGLEGTTLDYRFNQSRVEPVCENVLYEQDEIDNRIAIRQGILFFQKIFLLIEDSFSAKNVNFPRMGQMLHRLIQFPTKHEALSIGSLSYSSNFGSLTMHKIIEFEQLRYETKYRELLLEAASESYLSSSICWPQGELSLVDSTYVVDNMLKTRSIQFVKKISSHFKSEYLNGKIGIYGAGEIGKAVYSSLQFLCLNPICFIDKNKKIQGTVLNGIKIISPTEAINLNLDTLIIASLTFTDQIIEDLKMLYKEKIIDIQLIRLND